MPPRSDLARRERAPIQAFSPNFRKFLLVSPNFRKHFLGGFKPFQRVRRRKKHFLPIGGFANF
jgi:hypothetical protein